MKKLLLAVGLATAFGLAQAQSSVTVFGILDVGYTGVTTRSSTPATGLTKSNLNQFNQSGSTPSRLGFRGVEDLGSGTSALFMVDFQLYPQDARLSGPTQNGLVNRQTWVGLKQNGMGTAMVGTQFTEIHKQMFITDPGAVNDVVGSVIFPASNSSGVTTSAYTVRTSNTLQIQSDQFKGFSGGVMYSAKNQDTTQTGVNTGGNTNVDGYGLNANYTWNKLYATVVYQKLSNENPSTTVNPVATAMTNDNGSNVNDTQQYAAVTYDFGRFKASAQYVSRKAVSVLNSNQYLSRTAQQLGVRGKVTPKVTAFASVGNGSYQAFGSDNPTANFIGWQAGSEYALSKRTALYGIVGSHQTSSTSAGSAGANQYAVGMRHTF
jgi:predicted porin